MLLALSPMAAHVGETLCSLRFAAKVHSTHVGRAKAVRGAEGGGTGAAAPAAGSPVRPARPRAPGRGART